MGKNRKWISFLGILIIIVSGLILGIDSHIDSSTKPKIFNSVDLIPKNHAGLLLGTSKFLSSGNINPYFINRIKAAAELYHSGKIHRIVVSGDNSRKDYNEPQDMKEELIKLGVYENDIYLDYAGFRTYDSVIRMREIFGQDSFTVISQEFHNERAIFIASAFEIDAIGFNAVDLNASMGFKTNLREKFARVKMIVDLIFKQEPKFLGEKINIEERVEVFRDMIDLNDPNCLFFLDSARSDFATGRIVYPIFESVEIIRYQDEFDDLLEMDGIHSELFIDSGLSGSICYAYFMDSVVTAKFGEDYIEVQRGKADSIFLALFKTKIYRSWYLDKEPKYSENYGYADSFIKRKIKFPAKWDSVNMEHERQYVGLEMVINKNGEIEKWQFDSHNLKPSNEKYLDYLKNQISTIIKDMKSWEPGELNGHQVASEIYLDIELDQPRNRFPF